MGQVNKDSLFETQLDILKTDWSFVQDSIRGLDDIIFKIRGWAVTLSAAGLGYAYVHGDEALCLYMMMPVLVFWVLDGLFKSFQRQFIARDREIRNYLASTSFNEDFENQKISKIPISVAYEKSSGTWRPKMSRVRRHLKAMLLRNVLVSYLAIIVMQFGTFLILHLTP